MSSAAGPTPATLGALEPVRQRGAGTCGTVDCCCERVGQTHPWEAPSGRPKTSLPPRSRRSPTDNRARSRRPGQRARPDFACSGPPSTPSGFTSQPPRSEGRSRPQRPGVAREPTGEARIPREACLSPTRRAGTYRDRSGSDDHGADQPQVGHLDPAVMTEGEQARLVVSEVESGPRQRLHQRNEHVQRAASAG